MTHNENNSLMPKFATQDQIDQVNSILRFKENKGNIFEGLLVTKQQLSMIYRNHFFKAFVYLEENPLKELNSKALNLFKESAMTDNFLSPRVRNSAFGRRNLSWQDFENGSRMLDCNQHKLRSILQNWLIEKNLCEEINSEKWLLYQLVLLLNASEMFCEPVSNNDNCNIVSRNFAYSKISEFPDISGIDFLPPADLPKYQPNLLTRQDYFSRIKDFIKKDVETNPRLKRAESSHQNSFIDAVVKGLRTEIDSYCEKVEKFYIEKGYERFTDKIVRVNEGKQNNSSKVLRDINWTLESLLNNKSYSELGEQFAVASSTIHRAVEATIKILGLKTNKKKGRPRGNSTAEMLKDLGK